jgi:hypothetical protein
MNKRKLGNDYLLKITGIEDNEDLAQLFLMRKLREFVVLELRFNC